jgi:hypothetical protein
MPTEEMHPLDEVLKRQPSWEPPPGFARRVVVRASMDSRPWPDREHPRRAGFLRAAALGLAAAAGAYVVGVLLSALVASVVRETVTTVDGYARFMEVTARAIASRAVLVSWLCAVLSLGFAASFVRHVRD